jgi:DNA-binding transcriptional ArsR family regulator
MGASEILAALADPTRRALLARIARSPQRVGDLARGFRISRPAISRHLHVLRDAALVVAHKRGRERYYRLSPKGLEDVQKYMAQVARFWDVSSASSKRRGVMPRT